MLLMPWRFLRKCLIRCREATRHPMLPSSLLPSRFQKKNPTNRIISNMTKGKIGSQKPPVFLSLPTKLRALVTNTAYRSPTNFLAKTPKVASARHQTSELERQDMPHRPQLLPSSLSILDSSYQRQEILRVQSWVTFSYAKYIWQHLGALEARFIEQPVQTSLSSSHSSFPLIEFPTMVYTKGGFLKLRETCRESYRAGHQRESTNTPRSCELHSRRRRAHPCEARM